MHHAPFRYYRKGFCSIVTQILTIAHEHWAIYGNLDVAVQDKQTLCLFDNPSVPKNCDYDAAKSWLNVFFTNPKSLKCQYNAHIPANIQELKSLNFIYNTILKIKPNKLSIFEEQRKEYINKKTLGVQIRGTDKLTELPAPDIEKILSMIEGELKREAEDVFICTDDIQYLSILKKNFGDLIKYNKSNIISMDGAPLHSSREFDRTLLNQQVLGDVYLLSKCKNFFYCYSNVSQLALIMGINDFEKVELLN